MKFISLTFILFCFLSLRAQEDNLSLQKHVKLAETLAKEGKYADAGFHYEQAWRKKVKNKDNIYLAGECYYAIKDYRKAIEAWRHVKDDNSEYPLIGLKYARCLKQDCQYDGASREFVYFFNTYAGTDKDIIGGIIQNEIRGCELGIQLTEKNAGNNIKIEHLGENINTAMTEFAPVPFNDDILYFSSTMRGKAKIYRSQYKGGEWAQAETPSGFPALQEVHFGNGSFAPDASRFYFTQCKEVTAEKGTRSQCEIFLIKRNASGWSDPIRLRDYINMTGATTTQPCIVHRDGKEILYFVSDREGGFGGLDIWYAARELISDDIDFTLPVNVGADINTLGDEVTPWYDKERGKLYFSSNGRITIGGFDVFLSSGSSSQWTNAENIGLPYNSCADDFYFCLNKSQTGGFVVSNRLHGMEKVTTSNEDIFNFYYPEEEIMATGKIFDKTSNQLIADARVGLYERLGNGEKRLLNIIPAKEGNYSFELMPNKKLRIEIEKAGYTPSSYDFETNMAKVTNYGQPFFLEKIVIAKPDPKPPVATPTAAKPKINEKPSDPPVKPKAEPVPPVVTSAARPTSNNTEVRVSSGTPRDMKPATEPFTLRTSAPVLPGKYYKLQLVALKIFDSSQSQFRALAGTGRYDTEYIVGKDITRVLIGDFITFEEATKALGKAKVSFRDAYIVRYEDGIRMGAGQ